MMGIELLFAGASGIVQAGAEWGSDKLSRHIGLKRSPGTRFALQWLIGFLMFLAFLVIGAVVVFGLFWGGLEIVSGFGPDTV